MARSTKQSRRRHTRSPRAPVLPTCMTHPAPHLGPLVIPCRVSCSRPWLPLVSLGAARQEEDAQKQADMKAEIAVLERAIQQFEEGQEGGSSAAAARPATAPAAAPAKPTAAAGGGGAAPAEGSKEKDKKDKKAEKDAKFKAKQAKLAAEAEAKAAKGA